MRVSSTRVTYSACLCSLLIPISGCGTSSSLTLNSLSVAAIPSSIKVGGTATLKAVAHLSDGTTEDVTSGTQWTVSSGSLATIGGGMLTGKSAGTVTVQVAYVAPASSSQWSIAQTLSSSAPVTIDSAAAGASMTAPMIT